MKRFQYNHLASVYEHLMRKIDYEGWAEYLLDIIDYYDLDVKSGLELAAGNCKITDQLVSKIPGLLASDLSYQMLKQNTNKSIPKIACDMTSLPFKSKFDFVFSTFDSINYLLDKTALKNFFDEAANLLSCKGILTFDASLERNSIKNVKHLNRKGKHDGIHYRQESEFLSDKALHINKFSLKLPDGTTVEEVHEQKIYHFEEYFEVIDNTNLYVSDCFDFFTFKDADPDCDRVQFILGKIE